MDRQQKSPTDILDYHFHFEDWLEDGDSVDTFELTVEDGVTKLDKDSESGGIVTIWLTDGLNGESYLITCVVSTVDNRRYQKSFILDVLEQ